MSRRILVVDDDADIVRLINDSFSYEGYEVLAAGSGEECLEMLSISAVDFVILDIMLPGEDGLEICKKIRQLYELPILFLSAKNRDIDKIIGLEMGGDDYMTKPFSVQELVSRVKAYFRKMERVKTSLEREFEKDSKTESSINMEKSLRGLILNEELYEVQLNGERLEFSTKEFQILLLLSNHPKQVLTREQIYNRIWGDDFGDINTVTVHIKNIRKKLGKECDVIKTIWGVGYRYSVEG